MRDVARARGRHHRPDRAPPVDRACTPIASTCSSAAASWKSGRHDELLERKGLYYAMWRQQVGERRPSVKIEPKASGRALAAAGD